MWETKTVGEQFQPDLTSTGTVRYRTVRYLYRTVRRYLVPYRTVSSQISFALTGFFARAIVRTANHLFYRFRTVFRALYVIRPCYESCVRPVSPSDLLLCSRTCERFTSTRVVIVPYSRSFRHQSVIIRLLSSKIHIRDSYVKKKKKTVHSNQFVMTNFGLIEAP